MPSKRRKRSKSSNRRKNPPGPGLALLGFLEMITAFVVVGVYFWGTVQIDFILRENDRLRQAKRSLQHNVDRLQGQINSKKSYQRITALAQKQGLVFIKTTNTKELGVDLVNIKPIQPNQKYELKYAGMTLIGLNKH